MIVDYKTIGLILLEKLIFIVTLFLLWNTAFEQVYHLTVLQSFLIFGIFKIIKISNGTVDPDRSISEIIPSIIHSSSYLIIVLLIIGVRGALNV